MCHPTHASPDANDLTESDRYRLLSSERRRITLDVLVGQEPPIELTELATGIAARENGAEAIDDEIVAYVACSLHHVHLPVIDEFGLIDYAPDANRIRSCPTRLDVRIEH
ncbi:DUF7344 domain-containing protein [Natrinema ejinorense]|uniref:DUF7344 domain-containing protein n=1 Tax=Natrinema ejinorense TaxID=373386 RepID=A0A2A5QQ88_9EURY|nr:hypothetical protein [Natrinema ejinorense]PCR88959.1 hypothetical protein CP557_21025 [Natrinema ejinorense]